MIETLAGIRTPGFNGDGLPAAEAELHHPCALAIDGTGNLYLADRYNWRVRRIDPGGMITTVAGAGLQGRAGDGGLATEAGLGGPTGLALDGSGSLYVAERRCHRVRKIDANGIISSVAGTGEQGFRGDRGLAVEALLDGPEGVVADKAGNVYVADCGNHRVRRIGPDGVITTVAGTGRRGSSGDGGPASEAYLWSPTGLALDQHGNLYVAERGNHQVRRIDPDGVITTIAGTGASGYSGDGGSATEARLNEPGGLAVDAGGALYIADVGNHRIRKVDAARTITTVAGSGEAGFGGDGGPATAASLRRAEGLAVDAAGNLFIADAGNHIVRVVRPDRQVSVQLGRSGKRLDFARAGDGSLRRGDRSYTDGSRFRADGRDYVLRIQPDGESVATHARQAQHVRLPGGGVIRIAAGEDGVWRIGSRSVSNGHKHRRDGTDYCLEFADGRWRLAEYMIQSAVQRPEPADRAPAGQVPIDYPSDIAVGGSGIVYVADSGDNCVWRIDRGGVSTVACQEEIPGGGTAEVSSGTGLLSPERLAADSEGNVYVSEFGRGRVHRIDVQGSISTVRASSPEHGGAATPTLASSIGGLATDRAGCLYVADRDGHRVRKVDAQGVLRTIAGTGRPGFEGDGGPASEAALDSPACVAADEAGNVFVADSRNGRVRRIDAAGIIETVAGTGEGFYTGDGGLAASAYFGAPGGVAVGQSGDVYISDTRIHRVRKVDSSGVVTTIAGCGAHGYGGDGGPAARAKLYWPAGVVVDPSGNTYFADSWNSRVRRIDESGRIETIAGTGKHGFAGDGGPAVRAVLNVPQDLALDPGGNLYIADSKNHRIRMIDVTGTITTIAGTGTKGRAGDGGPATRAGLSYPHGVEADSAGNVYVGDSDNHRVRKIDAAGTISAVAGSGRRGNGGDGGPATAADLNWPSGLALDGCGNLYVADQYNNRVRKIDPSGRISTVAGTGRGAIGADGVSAERASLHRPRDVAVDRCGNLFIAEKQSGRVRCVDIRGTIRTFAGGGDPHHNGDGGPAARARLAIPARLALDGAGNVYVAESSAHRVRKFAPGGRIITLAGTGEAGFSGDGGPSCEARITGPEAVATDSAGNVYVADSGNRRVRRIDSAGAISTFAGSGRSAELWRGGPPSQGAFSDFAAIATDAAGNVCFVAANRMWRLDATGAISQVLVAWKQVSATDEGESGRLESLVADAAGNLYVAAGRRVLRIDPAGATIGFAGTGEQADGWALEAPKWEGPDSPLGVEVDPAGNVFYCDAEHARIRKIDPDGAITTVTSLSPAGGPNVHPFGLGIFHKPYALAMASGGSLFVADSLDHRILRIDLEGDITVIAGTGEEGFSGDGGPARLAKLSSPTGVTTDAAGNLYLADRRNRRVRKIDTAGVITTIAGTGEEGFSGDGGRAEAAVFREPNGVAADAAGNVYVSDSRDHRIRKIDAAGLIHTLAGTGERIYRYGEPYEDRDFFDDEEYDEYDDEEETAQDDRWDVGPPDIGDDGPATQAKLCFPEGVATDKDGNVYVADAANERVRAIGPSGVIRTIAGTDDEGFSGDGGPAALAALEYPRDVAVSPSGDIYLSDWGNRCIRKIDSSGVITSIRAEEPPSRYGGDAGPAARARFIGPLELAADGQGNVYVADAGDRRVRKIRVDGTIDLFAGTGEQGWSGDGGRASVATFDCPSRIAASATGEVYVADTARHQIRKIDSRGIVFTVAGTGERGFSGDGGPATEARLAIQDIALDERGNLYVAHGGRVRRIDTKGIITTVAGTGRVACSGDGGPASAAGLSAYRIAAGPNGDIWFTDAANSRIRVLRRQAYG